MTNRVIPADVRMIIETDLDDPTIEVFIGVANILINEVIGSSGLSDDLLLEIERWLTAHFMACSRERQIASERVVGDITAVYTGQTAKGLEATLYGQQAMMLDTTGLLASAIGKRVGSIYAVTSFSNG